jgi:uncharacterized membrane protein YqiK
MLDNSLVTTVLFGIGLFLALLTFLRITGMLRYIPNTRVSIVEKLWSFRGSIEQGLIALKGEAGFQPDVVRGGFHVFFPLQYRLHSVPLVTVSQGEIGYVFARDGRPLAPSQTLASNAKADNFEDVRAFLEAGGQKGPQRKILREGTYAINLAQFVVLSAQGTLALNLDKSEAALFAKMSEVIRLRTGFLPVVIKDDLDRLGIVTTHDGPALPPGEIIAPPVGDDPADASRFHNNFQDCERFLQAGGFRGRQYQVLVEGTYYINRLFATVELLAKTVIPVGSVGVVVSYTGKQGQDMSGEEYRHGELVAKGTRGVWMEPLLPGKYAFNTYAGQVMLVPTTNFILKWSAEVTRDHKFDENLSEVSLITKDAFEPTLPLSVVVHIDYKKAPLVVQRFGDIKRLVEQTLDPMVSAYFKNIAQTKTLIELLQQRSELQNLSSVDMKSKFAMYSLELQEVLIGTPHSSGGVNEQIEQILIQLRERQVAKEKVETYQLKERAATQERTLREAEARAEQQKGITASQISVEIKTNEGRAALAFAQQAAERVKVEAGANATRVKVEAEATAERLRLEGEGEARKVEQVGLAQARATAAQVDAFGGPQFQLTQQVMARFAEAVERGKVDIVPKVMVGGGADGKDGMAGNVFSALMALMLSARAGVTDLTAPAPPPAAPVGSAAPEGRG